MQEIFDRLAKYYSVLEHAYSDVFEDSKSSSEKDAIESMDVDEANNYLIGESQGVVLVSIGGGSTARGKDAADCEDEDGDDGEEDEEGEKQDDDDREVDGDEEKNGDLRRNPGDLEKQEEDTPDTNNSNLQRYASIDGSDIDGGSGHDYHDVGVILSSRQ